MSTHNLVGRKVGQYEMKEHLGWWGFGAVYRANHPKFKHDLEMKVMFSTEPEHVEWLMLEGEMMARLEHPHIASVYDYGSEGQVSYMAKRLFTGGTLTTRLAERRGEAKPLFSPQEVNEVLQQLADALNFGHSRGMIHRDISASNIFFDEFGNAYLSDFRVTEASSGLTKMDMITGNPIYMAPEAWHGQAISSATDQYALGVLLYIMLNGEAPFQAATPLGLMDKHLHEIPMPLHEIRQNVSVELSAVVGKALSKQASDRFEDVIALAKAFETSL